MAKGSRAPRGALAREAVVAAAVEELRTVRTVEELTVARVATRLGVKPMSLYTHIRNKDDLVRAVAVALFQPLGVDAVTTREGLVRMYREYFQLLLDYPALVQIVNTRWEMIAEMYPGLMEPAQRARFLVDQGVAEHDALVLLSALSRYTLGCAALFRARPAVDHPAGGSADLEFESAEAQRSHTEVFEFGLAALLRSVLPETDS